jgi:hypothetical protein
MTLYKNYEWFENVIKEFMQTSGAWLSSKMYEYSKERMNSNDNKGIMISCVLMFLLWIAGIIGMIYCYVTIALYKTDPNSGSKLFKDIYAGCHCAISIILLLYVIVKSESFNNKYINSDTVVIVKGGALEPALYPVTIKKARLNFSDAFDKYIFKPLVSFLINIPINVREDFENLIAKFKTIDYDGIKYKNEINLGVMFKLVIAHCPIIIFLVVLTSIVSMIKAYHKILCGNTNSSVVIDWPFKLIDIVMYAIFRIVGLIILLKNFFSNQKTTFLLSIFYFTAVYLIIRFVLLLYENMFSNTIVSLYKWDIRESDCTINKSNDNGTWIFDPIEREQVKTQQNLKNSNKLANDVFSLIFNILIILFLSGISIISAFSLFFFGDKITLNLLLEETTEIGRKTINIDDKVISEAISIIAKNQQKEVAPSESEQSTTSSDNKLISTAKTSGFLSNLSTKIPKIPQIPKMPNLSVSLKPGTKPETKLL